MHRSTFRFRLLDALYLAMMIVPVAAGMILQLLTKPIADGIEITGARVFFTIPLPLQDFPVTESQVHSVIALFVISGFCLYVTHGISEHAVLKRQHLAEWIVEKVDALVLENMGTYFRGFSPFIVSMLALSGVSSLLTLFGLYAPTSDINVVGGWAILVFILITYYKMKAGPVYYLKSFTKPVAILTPINMISEVATPLSMAFRHYGNVLSGSVIAVLVGTGLSGLSRLLLGWLPGFLAEIPLFQVGIPAVLSIYFDVFSGLLQAFIFAMLTMMYVSGGFPEEEYEKRMQRRKSRRI